MAGARRRRPATEDFGELSTPAASVRSGSLVRPLSDDPTEGVIDIPDTTPAPMDVPPEPPEPVFGHQGASDEEYTDLLQDPAEKVWGDGIRTPHTLLTTMLPDPMPADTVPTLVETRSGTTLVAVPRWVVEEAWRAMNREYPEVSAEDFVGMLRGTLGSMGRWRLVSRLVLK